MDTAEILTFWFGELDAEGLADAAHRESWWRKDAAFDAEVRRRFLGAWQALTSGREPPVDTVESTLAAVLVLDQFSRNMFRDEPRAFSSDAQALTLARSAVDDAKDRSLPGQRRVFLYMPFMHSEQLADQDRGIALFSLFRDQSEGRLRDELDGNVRFAQQHRAIIARFGRFPHRNQQLGRASSAEEIAFLREPGSSF